MTGRGEMRRASAASVFGLIFLLSAVTAGCQMARKSWQPTVPRDVAVLDPDSVRVSVGYMQLVLHQPRIAGDSLVGFTYDHETLWSRVSVPIDSVERVDVIGTDAGRTALSWLGTAASLGLIVGTD